MDFANSYQDQTRADAYARLEFADTYHLAFRDLPNLLRTWVRGTRALDFGCGTGRSTRLLRTFGLDTVGIDISQEMIGLARERDPGGDYRLIRDGDFSEFGPASFDLILAAFTFDNIQNPKKGPLLAGLAGLLDRHGRLIMISSTPEIYTHEWASFSTKDYPENRQAKSGDVVSIVTRFNDPRPCHDILCSDGDYENAFQEAGLTTLETVKPLASGEEPFQWISERTIAPWIIRVLGKT